MNNDNNNNNIPLDSNDDSITVGHQAEKSPEETVKKETSANGQEGNSPYESVNQNNSTYAGNPINQNDNPYYRNENPSGGIRTYVGTGSIQNAGGTYYGGYPVQAPFPDKKKAKKEKSKSGGNKGIIAALIAACIILSALSGFGGMYVGMRFLNSSDGKGGTINYNSGTSNINKKSDGTVASATAIAQDSVVVITTEVLTTSFFGQYVRDGAGSGVVIDADGYIITCAHVIDGATSITVTLSNGDRFEATKIGSDAQTDIAVIKINATGLVAANIGDSEKLIVGETAIAIGNPLGTLGGSVSSGIISALDREIKIDGQDYKLLQIDTSINPGNSGGGLFDIDGNLIGIVNAKSSGESIEGLGFAIPINTAIEVSNQLVSKGYVGGRVGLGIYALNIDENMTQAELYRRGYSDLINYITDYGVYFLKYQEGQSGDLKFGDLIVAIDGTTVSSVSDITSLLGEYKVGDKVKVTVSRYNNERKRSQMIDLEVTLIEKVPVPEETTEK